MSRKDPQVNIRLPEDLKAELHEIAEFNSRSVNAEIVLRLQVSLLKEKSDIGIISADVAKELAQQSRLDGNNALLALCMDEVAKAAKHGKNEVVVKLENDDETNIEPTIAKLESLGYRVNVDDGGLWIFFE